AALGQILCPKGKGAPAASTSHRYAPMRNAHRVPSGSFCPGRPLPKRSATGPRTIFYILCRKSAEQREQYSRPHPHTDRQNTHLPGSLELLSPVTPPIALRTAANGAESSNVTLSPSYLIPRSFHN